MRAKEEGKRDSGLSVIGTVPWGTHLCLFYDTKQDLLDIWVPFLKAGLANNEFCICVTAEPLNDEEVKQALGKAVPDFDQYLKRGQIEVAPHTDWYLKDGAFNLQRALNTSIEKHNQALTRGYDGTRGAGSIAWLEERNWGNFTEYEAELNSVIGKYHVITICTYPLSKCGASELIDVMRNHQFAIIRQAGRWELVGPKEKRKTASRAKSGRRVTSLQEWFIRSGFTGLNDQEVIELLLSLCLPLRECRRLVRDCIKRFGNLRGFLSASDRELQRAGLELPALFCIRLLRELPGEILKQKIGKRPFYSSSNEVFDYLFFTMRDLSKEVFKVIYLNIRNRIIATADLFEGTITRAAVQPRKVIETAIEHNAVRLIFAHNHPSGDPTPSRVDKNITRDLVFIGMILQIRVLDHIIIGADNFFSFADDGLIKEYEDNFINMRIKGSLQIEQNLNLN